MTFQVILSAFLLTKKYFFIKLVSTILFLLKLLGI